MVSVYNLGINKKPFDYRAYPDQYKGGSIVVISRAMVVTKGQNNMGV